jgi:hypothetical protein
MIVGLSGSAGAGKDTAADVLVLNHKFVKVALADPLKRICREVFDFSEEQLWGPSKFRNAPDERYLRKVVVQAGASVGKSTELPETTKEYLTLRYALQQLGTEWGRDCYHDTWIDLAMRTAKKLDKDDGYANYNARDGYWEEDKGWEPRFKGVVISDVRFKNEIDAIHTAGGKVVRVVRLTRGLDGAAAQHRSETEQLEIPDSAFDYVLVNNAGLDTLPARIQQMLEAIL